MWHIHEERTAYGEFSGPSMLMFQFSTEASSTRLTVMPGGGLP